MNALLLVGSPKGRNSASFRLASLLGRRLRDRGVAVSDAMVHGEIRTEDGTARLVDAVETSDLVVFVFPLYVDSLPGPLTLFLEQVAARRAGAAPRGTPRLAVVVQCGFPEAHQCDTAVGICRMFAERTGMRWAGALAMGMGGSVTNDSNRLPGGGKHLLRALDMASASLASGGDVPVEAAALFARPLMPRWLYLLGGNLGWRLRLWKSNARRPIGHRPFMQE